MGILGTYPAGDTGVAEVLRAGEKLTLKAVLVAGGKAHLGLIPRAIESDVAALRTAKPRGAPPLLWQLDCVPCRLEVMEEAPFVYRLAFVAFTV